MSKLENELSVEALVERLYAACMDCLSERDPATVNAGVNAAALLAKMQGWDAPEQHESGKPGELDALTAEELRAKIDELAERINWKWPPPKTP